jgi:hypothetical protein
VRITQQAIERWGWGVWDAAVWDAKQLAGRGIDSRARRAGRNWLRSLERTRKTIEGGAKAGRGAV